MRTRTFGAVLLLGLASFPFTHASHAPVASPRDWCEDVAADASHEYGPGTGFVILLSLDGNADAADCDGDGLPGGYDGHAEFAFGGAWLTAASSPGCNDGDLADHAVNPHVTVADDALDVADVDVSFSVYADTLNNVPPVDPNEPNCGDFETDHGVDCIGACTVGFPPGLDGTYQVYVQGGSGRIDATPSASSGPCPKPVGHVVLPAGQASQWKFKFCSSVTVGLETWSAEIGSRVQVESNDNSPPCGAPYPASLDCAIPQTATLFRLRAVAGAVKANYQQY